VSVRWRIFVVTHERVIDKYYDQDPDFNSDNFKILNVTLGPIDAGPQYSVINQVDFLGFSPLGKHWAESEAIYNVYRNGLHKDLDYIGFLQYDKELCLQQKLRLDFLGKSRITRRIEDFVSSNESGHVSFETHHARKDYRQRILADESQPDTLQGPGLNAYDYILTDYNKFFGTAFKIQDFFLRGKINLCSCFLVDAQTFEKMMTFFSWVVESGKLEKFDSQRKHRIQGGLAERYFALFLAFEFPKFHDLSLPHHDIK